MGSLHMALQKLSCSRRAQKPAPATTSIAVSTPAMAPSFLFDFLKAGASPASASVVSNALVIFSIALFSYPK